MRSKVDGSSVDASRDEGGPGSLGLRLREARRSRGLTQGQLAEPEYSVAYVSRIEAGERTPSPEALAIFARRLGISPSSLLEPIPAADMVELERGRVGAFRALDEADFARARREADLLLERAQTHHSKPYRAAALTVLGEVEERAGDVERSLDLYREASALKADESLEEIAEMTIRLARVHRRLGDLGYSADLLEQAIARMAGEADLHPQLMARLHFHLSATCSDRGDLARAREMGMRAVDLAKTADDRRTLASALWAAAPPMAVADPARALSLIRRAGTIYAELGLTLELGRLHIQMAITALDANDRPSAEAALDRAQELLGDDVTPEALSTVLLLRAEFALSDGNPGEAQRLARDVIALAERIEPLDAGRARRVLGEAVSSQDPEAAERELRAAIELFTSAGAQMDAARCFRSLGDLLVRQGRSDEALEVFRDGLGIVEGAA